MLTTKSEAVCHLLHWPPHCFPRQTAEYITYISSASILRPLITINAPSHCNDGLTIMAHKLIQCSAANTIMLLVFTLYVAELVDDYHSQRQSL